VASVELSLSEPFVPAVASITALERWRNAVVDATEACLVIDSVGTIVAVSAAASRLLGFESPEAATMANLFHEGVVRLLDFTSSASVLPDEDLRKTAPALALSSGRLARGLIRVRSGGQILTIDAISTPLFDGTELVGSLTFFAPV
jgi:PAS domain-containing protein